MKKQTAFALLETVNVRDIAQELSISPQAVYKWPDDSPLPRATADRVLAAWVRKSHKRRRNLTPVELDAMST